MRDLFISLDIVGGYLRLILHQNTIFKFLLLTLNSLFSFILLILEQVIETRRSEEAVLFAAEL